MDKEIIYVVDITYDSLVMATKDYKKAQNRLLKEYISNTLPYYLKTLDEERLVDVISNDIECFMNEGTIPDTGHIYSLALE